MLRYLYFFLYNARIYVPKLITCLRWANSRRAVSSALNRYHYICTTGKIGANIHCQFICCANYIYLRFSHVTGEMVPDNELCNNIDPSQPVTFVVHGFTSYANSSQTRDLAMQLKHVDITLLHE